MPHCPGKPACPEPSSPRTPQDNTHTLSSTDFPRDLGVWSCGSVFRVHCSLWKSIEHERVASEQQEGYRVRSDLMSVLLPWGSCSCSPAAPAQVTWLWIYSPHVPAYGPHTDPPIYRKKHPFLRYHKTENLKTLKAQNQFKISM